MIHDPVSGEIIILRTPYNYDREQASLETGLECLDKSLTQQNSKDDADINIIMERFGHTGVLPQGARLPSYGDFDGVTDYHSAMNAIKAAEGAFLALPATIRDRFENDPQQLIAFMDDESNRPEAEKLGLVEAQPDVTSVPPKDGA